VVFYCGTKGYRVRAVIDAAANAVEMRSDLPEMPHEKGFVLGPQIKRGEDSELVHFRGGRWSDTMKPLNRQRLDKARSHCGRDDE
jgi:hypothetical protein